MKVDFIIPFCCTVRLFIEDSDKGIEISVTVKFKKRWIYGGYIIINNAKVVE